MIAPSLRPRLSPCRGRIMNGIERNRITSRVGSRFFSSVTGASDGIVTTSVDEATSLATMVLNRPPVNSLSLEMCRSISQNLKNLERNHPTVRSLLVTSSNPKIFSAGIAVEELYEPDPQRLALFWTSFQQLFIDLYLSRFATIAVLEGHAIAGGCLIALCADYRIITDDGNDDGKKSNGIGLNETKLGIAAPVWMADLMVRTVGTREAEKALGLGWLYTPEEARKVGLVDEVVVSEEIEERAEEVAKMWARIPATARVTTKRDCRERYVEELKARRGEDLSSFCDFVMREGVQENLGSYIDNLKRKKKGA